LTGRVKQLRGFASMDPEKQRRIASKGGKAAHESGHAHEWTSKEAREAGRKGGLASHAPRGSKRKPKETIVENEAAAMGGLQGAESAE
jgi:general stress protein YciG